MFLFFFFLIPLPASGLSCSMGGSLLHHAGSFISARRLSSCGVWAQQLQHTGLGTLWHVGS